MRYVLTGARGYLGSWLLDALLDAGHEVHCLGRGELDAGPYAGAAGRVVPHRFDGSLESVRACTSQARADAVIHLAARLSRSDAPEETEDLVRANTLFPSWLLQAAVEAGTRRFINTGSWWQWDAEGRYSPVCLYAATKQAFENVLQFHVERDAVRAATLVLYDVYGPRDPRPKILQLVLNAFREQRPLPMTAGEQQIAFLHVRDAVRAYLRLLEHLEAAGGSGLHEHYFAAVPTVTLEEAIRRLEQLLGKPTTVRLGELSYGPRTRMQPYFGPPVPGWQPQVDLEQGLRSLIDA